MTRRHDLRLFDDFVRTDGEYARRTEAGFGWWNRSARSDIAAMRDELEYWFGRYCPSDAPRLRREFRSRQDAQHVAALFELFVHEHLLKAGYEVQCQVELKGSSNRPDFLVLAEGQPAFYVEAKAKLTSAEALASEQRRQEVLEVLRHLRSPDFFVGVVMYGAPSKSVDKRPLVREILQWLGRLDHDAEVRRTAFQPNSEYPTLHCELDGFKLEFEAIPRTDSREIDFGTFLDSEIDGDYRREPTEERIAEAVEEKGSKYADLGLPYLIATALSNFTTDQNHVELGVARAWGTPLAPRHRRVSGLLLANVSSMAAAVAHIPHLVLNPMAEHPLGEHAAAFTPFAGHLRTPSTATTP